MASEANGGPEPEREHHAACEPAHPRAREGLHDPTREDADHEPDLFWALRGGNGNFGVVTALEFAVYPVDELYAGVMFFPFQRAAEVLHAWTELVPTLPDAMMSWASLLQFPDAPFVPEPVRGGSFTVVISANGIRASPSNETLAAPSTKAVHTMAGGPGRSSAAITSHSSSSAGAMAAAPMTVGRVSSRFMSAGNR